MIKDNALIIKFGHSAFLAIDAQYVSEMINALSTAVVVSHEGFYDSDKNYIINPAETIEFKIIHGSRIVMPEKTDES